MNEKSMARNSKLRVLWIIIAVIGLGVGYVILDNSPGWKFLRAYRQLQFGMTQNEVIALFGDKPEFDCRFRSSQIWYFRAPGFFTGDFDDITLKRGATVPTLNDLPNVYDYVQIAFDSQGQLHSYTWIGETYTVESIHGTVSGSDFSLQLPANF